MNETKSELRTLYEQDISAGIKTKSGTWPRFRRPSQYLRVQDTVDCRHIDPEQDNVWITSDLHIGHRNIIRYSNRPFEDTSHMDRCLIDRYNEYVQDNDVCLMVGDATFYSSEKSKQYIDQLNGYKILIVGNHDFHKKEVKQMGFDEIHLLYTLQVPEGNLVFTHFPMWNLPTEYVNIHGHLHINSTEKVSPQHINVCCEFHDYQPLHVNTIRTWISEQGK